MPTLKELFSPFYDFGRRKLSLPPNEVREYLDHHAVATMTGKVVELKYTDGHGRPHVLVGGVTFGHTRHAAEWVNEFNQRAAKLHKQRAWPGEIRSQALFCVVGLFSQFRTLCRQRGSQSRLEGILAGRYHLLG